MTFWEYAFILLCVVIHGATISAAGQAVADELRKLREQARINGASSRWTAGGHR